MLRFLPFAIELVLLVYCLIDCIQTDSLVVRNLSKGWWILLILFFPIIGSIAWLVAGRPESQRRSSIPWPSTRTAGFPEYERPRRAAAPDDDPQFLAEMHRADAEQQEILRKWEADLRRREGRQRESAPEDPTTPDEAPA